MEFDNNFYQNLIKPDFQPPQWLFKPVWIILYILMGVSLFIVSRHAQSSLKWAAIALFLIQLMLNLSWSPLFFVYHKIRSALFICILLTITVFFMIIVFSKLSLIAAILQIPYLLWLIFASILNAAIVKLNPCI
ncbi:MAG: TspO/MBR family protein [Candidatus Gastranaerophilaceae bacterium]